VAVDPIVAVIIQLGALLGVLLICWIQARRKKTSFFDQVEKWQGSLAVIIGFSAVIWTMRFNLDSAQREETDKALKWYSAELFIVGQINFQAIQIDANARVATEARKSKNSEACKSALREIQVSKMHPLEPFGMSDVDTLQIPPARLAGIIELRSKVEDINQRIENVHPDEICAENSKIGQFALEMIQLEAQSIEMSYASLIEGRATQTSARQSSHLMNSGR